MAAYAWTPSALTWLHVNHLINGLHKQISWKNCLYADNLYFTLATCIATDVASNVLYFKLTSTYINVIHLLSFLMLAIKPADNLKILFNPLISHLFNATLL